MWNAIFGVMRATELAKTPLIGSYSASDQVLLGEIVLRGQVHQVPERLFFRRRHSQQSWRSYHSQSQRAVWFDPATTKLKVPRAWKHYAEYLRAIRRVPMNLDEQTWCTFHVTKWLFKSAAKPVRRGLGLWSKERSAQARIWKGEEA